MEVKVQLLILSSFPLHNEISYTHSRQFKKKHQLVNHDSSIAYRTVSDIQCGDIKLMLDRIYIYVYIY